MTKVSKIQRFPVGLLLFALLLMIYKASMLSVDAGDGWRAGIWVFAVDLFYFSFLLILALAFAAIKNRTMRAVAWLLLVFLCAIYLVDSFVLLALDEHADLFDIGRYGLEQGVVLSFFDNAAYIAIASLLLSLFLLSEFSGQLRNLSISLFSAALLIGTFSGLNAPRSQARYAMLKPTDLLNNFAYHAPAAQYSNKQMAFYAQQVPEQAAIPASRPNIILVMVESLSSINSYKTSGVGNILEQFDKLAEEGVLFRNFFANHQASEGGVIALLGGYPPIHYPGATPYMFDEFADQHSVIADYRQQGYFTEFLTNSDLSFIGLNHFLEALPLDSSRGRDEFASMRTADRVVQAAPSDHLLYNEALVSLGKHENTQKPYLMVLATTSTHLPYTHPEGGADTATAVWRWSLRQLTEFYRRLENEGYFEDGILLITGDHRQMRRLSKQEIDRYGGSARARVPLLVIGKDYPANRIDERFFQQSDLLRLLDKITRPEVQLSPHPIWVERYNRKYGQIELIDNLSVFDQADDGRLEYRLSMFGNDIDWIGDQPHFASDIELKIHSQRSQHQKNRNNNQH